MLDNTPGTSMMTYFPQLQSGLFLLLGDEQQEIASVRYYSCLVLLCFITL